MVLLEDAKAIEEAGASILLVEGVPPETGKIITEALSIPVLGIGAGPYCDGQLLIVSDMLGLFEAFTPKFVKKYANLADIIRQAFQEYAREIREGKFPTLEHCYKMKAGEAEKLEKLLERGRGENTSSGRRTTAH